MPDETPHIEQKVDGIGNATAAGANSRAYSKTIFNIPVEKFLMAELSASIAIQWAGYLCVLPSLMVSYKTALMVGLMQVYVNFFCFPLIFGPNAIYGLFMGYQLKDRKIKLLSIISGITSIAPLLFCFSSLMLLKIAGVTSKIFGINDELLQLINKIISTLPTSTPTP